jgi:hypothetical protein
VYKFVSLGIALTAFIGLAIFGFAVWVFISVLPAAILLIFAVMAGGRSTVARADSEKESKSRKAA